MQGIAGSPEKLELVLWQIGCASTSSSSRYEDWCYINRDFKFHTKWYS